MVLVTDVYEFEQIIGEGSFSNVVLATHNVSQHKYAIKIIDKAKIITDVQRERADREIEILKMCNHPNIVKLVETFESDDEISLVMELMSGGDLFDRITSKGVFTEIEARASMRHILSAVDFLHDRSLVHRDLKPENLLYSSNDSDAFVKLSDFGLSKFSNEKDNEGLQTPCGTIAYTAPEITNSKVYRKGVDIWSCGCILYFMLFGRPPFYSEDEEEIYDLVSEGKWAFPDAKVSEPAKDMIKKLLEKDPNKRISVKQAIAHPFMTQKELAPVNVLRTSLQLSPDVAVLPAPQPAAPAIVLSLSPTTAPSAANITIAFAKAQQQQQQQQLQQNQQQITPPTTPQKAAPLTPSTPSTPSPSLAIPNLRASYQSAMEAQRGPLTPPLVSPLESNIWKKRAKTRALQLHNASADLSLDLSMEDSNDGFHNNKKEENDIKFGDAMDMELGLTYQ